MLRAFAFAGAAALLASCAAPGLRPVGELAPVADAPFTAEGRLSARHAADAVSANFRWEHTPPRDELELATPLGQTVAQLSGDASIPYARVRLADGQSLEARDWAALTERALGYPLPVFGLAAWIRGGPHAGSRFQAEQDDRSRLSVLRQDGWEIVFEYEEAVTPARLRLTYPGVEVRVAVSRVQ